MSAANGQYKYSKVTKTRYGKAVQTLVAAFRDDPLYAYFISDPSCDELIETHAPGNHWKVSPIAISPEVQGRGYGSLLLQDGLDRLDRAHASCVLETQTRNNERFYNKHGFDTYTVAQIPQAEFETIVILRAGK